MAGGTPDARSSDVGASCPAPGDEAPPGALETGENVCPECHGSGRIGRIGRGPCRDCEGTRKVVEGIGVA